MTIHYASALREHAESFPKAWDYKTVKESKFKSP
jgi:hypothetical protein